MRLFTQFIITIVFIALATSASAIPFRPSSNQFIMGTGTTEDLFLTGDIGSGASNPYIKLDSASGKWQFLNSGASSPKNFGSGSGSGGDGGKNILVNSGTEDGTEGWTTSGGSLSSQLYVNPSEGDERYLRFTATASGQYVEQTFAQFPDRMGTGCMADLWYIQGDNAFTLDIVESGESQQLSDSSSWQKAPTLTTRCPDAGTPFTIRITSTGAGVIDFDNIYLGSNKNISDIPAIEEQMAAFTYVAKASDSTIQFSSGLSGINDISGDIFSESSNGTTGTLITFLKPADVTLTARMGNSSTQGFWIQLNGNNVTAETTAQSAPVDTGSATARLLVNTGDVLRVWGSASTFNQGSMVVTATSRSVKPSVYTPEQAKFFVSAFIVGANVPLSTTATPIIPNNANLTLTNTIGSASVACEGASTATGTTCSSGNEQVGIVVNIPISGRVKTCMTTSIGYTSEGTVRLVMTEDGSDSILGQSSETINNVGSNQTASRLCSYFNIPSSGLKSSQ